MESAYLVFVHMCHTTFRRNIYVIKFFGPFDYQTNNVCIQFTHIHYDEFTHTITKDWTLPVYLPPQHGERSLYWHKEIIRKIKIIYFCINDKGNKLEAKSTNVAYTNTIVLWEKEAHNKKIHDFI